MLTTGWSRSRRTAVALVAALLLSTSMTAVATATFKKTFTATANPTALTAGASYGSGARAGSFITVKLTNGAPNQKLGSSNLSAPAGISVSGATTSKGTVSIAGGVIKLRNLNLSSNQSVTVALAATVECGPNHSSYVWSVKAKQSNDFNGTGNDLNLTSPLTSTVSGRCGLAWTGQPAHAAKSPAVVTTVNFDPAADPVRVSVVDAQGLDVVSWWSGSIALTLGDDPTAGGAVLAGGLSSAVSGGSATFTPRLDRSGTGYSLIAKATATAGTASAGTSTAGVESANFNIVDTAATCASAGACSATAGQGGRTEAQVDASGSGGSAGDLVLLSINDPALVLDCAGYTETSDLILANVTTSDGITPSNRSFTMTLTLDRKSVKKLPWKYEVCFESVLPFKAKDGTTGTKGLLPTCWTLHPKAPCIAWQALNLRLDLVIVIKVPPGDPKVKF